MVIAGVGHGWGLAIFPLLATFIAAAFAVLLGRQLARRWRPHEAAWVLALLMFAAASFCVFLGVGKGWRLNEFRLYWLLGAVLNVPFLLLGEVYLLLGRRWGQWTAGILVALGAFAGWEIWTAAPHAAALARTLPLGKDVFGDNSVPYRLAQYVSYPAYFLLLGGLAWSAMTMKGRPELRDRTTGTVGIAMGATIVAVGSFAGAGFNIVPLFSVCLAAGIAVMFWGFLRAGRPTARGAPARSNP